MSKTASYPPRILVGRAALLLLLLLAVVFGAAGCRQSPSQEECLRSLENFLRLNTGNILSDEDIARMAREAMSQEMAKRVCIEEKSRKQVLCEIEADSLQALRQCQAQSQ